jgi:UDP-glucose 4-epimerase
MSKILITGGNGFIGHELIKKLTKIGHEIVSLDILPPKKINKKIIYHSGSILNRYDLDAAMKDCDVVFHFAAMVGVALTEKKRLECLEINIQGTKTVLEAVVRQKVKKIIFSSSSEVYGDQEIIPINENADLKPKSNYGITKLVGEEYIKAFSKFYKFSFNIVRFFNLYGGTQRNDFVIPIFKNIIQNNKTINIYGEGNQIRSYCHINDAVSGIVKVLEKGKKQQTYNIGNNNEPISVKELANKMINISQKNIKIKKIPFEKSDRSKKREIYKRQPDISKLKKDTNYLPKINLEKGIRKLLQK